MMLWNLIFMLAGALIFAAGVFFERDFAVSEETEEADEPYTEETEEISPRVLKQWENLLGYDGNEQEDSDEIS